MNKLEGSIDHRRIRRSVWLVLTISILFGYVLQSVAGSVYYSMMMQANGTVTSPPVTLQNGTAGISTIYTNSTSAKTRVTGYPYDFVDNEAANVDSSSDRGSHSNFSAQQYGPDSTYDTLTEENTEGIEDYVDNNTSDIDSSTDLGTHSNFENQKAQDSSYDTLTEVSQGNTYSLDATGGYMIVGDGTPDWGSTTGTISFWVKMDTAVQGRFYGQDGNMETRWSGTNLILDWGGTGSMTSAYSFSADTWYFVAIVWDENNDNLFLYVGDENSPPTLDANSLNGTWTSTTPAPTENRFLNGLGGAEPVDGHGDDLRYWNIARSLAELQSDYNQTLSGSEPNLQSYFKLDNNFDDVGPNNDDGSASGGYSFSTDVPFIGSSDYGLDLEVQWISVVDFLPTEKLCIYAGTFGAEDLNVDFWNGTGWEDLATDLVANSWNNYTVSLTSATFTIRFKDVASSGDMTQDQWQIDASLLRVGGAGSEEVAVDNDTSDEDSSSDLGVLTDFTNMTAYNANMGNLTETTGVVDGDWGDTNNPGGTSAAQTTARAMGGTSPDVDNMTLTSISVWWGGTGTGRLAVYQGGALDNLTGATLVWDAGEVAIPATAGWVTISGGSASLAKNEVTWIAWKCDDADYYYETSWDSASDFQSARGRAELTAEGVDSTDVWDATIGTFSFGTYWYDMYINYTVPANYQLDQEVQWTDVPYSLPNEELCIYGGTMGTEDIKVDVWNETGWETVFTDLSSGWNNASITNWLTTSNLTIRFKGGTETSDTNQTTWQIDVALIHVWNTAGEENYELDLEVQWTNVDYTQTNEELCIKTGTTDAEDIKVDVWNGSAWINVLTDLTPNSWNNVSVSSYLNSLTFTIRFKGSNETGDTNQDSWNIDSTLLHVWTNQDTLDYVDNNTTDLDSSADKGTHGNFTAQKYLDGIYDPLTEADTSTPATSDNNVDSETITHGSTTGISGAQTTDGTTENMTEGTIEKIGTDTSGTGNNLTLSFSHTLVSGTNRIVIITIGIENGNTTDVDSVAYGGQACTKAIDHIGITAGGFRYLVEIWYILDADLPSDGSQTVNVTCSGIIYELEVNAFCSEYAGVTQGVPEATHGYNQTSGSTITNTISPSDNAWVISGVGAGNVGNWTHGEGQVEVLEFDDASSTFAVAELRGANGETSLSSTYTGTINRLCRASASWTEAAQVDIEHVVNSIGEYENYNLTTRAYRTASESFYLQLYNFTSSQWANMSTITASSLTWYNTSFAKTDFVNSTNQARIRYWQGVDATQEILYVDYSGVYGWNATTKYELDLEVQWTGADYTGTNEELCIKTGTFSGSENIQVNVWNNTGSSWHWVMNLTAGQWNNVSITSYLTSNTFAVQYLGGTETDDTSQDSWNIDSTLLHVWTGASNWLSGWDKRVKITIDHNDIDSDLSNLPVLVHLSNSSGRNNDDVTFVFDEVGSNSRKIALTKSDGTTHCYVEIEKWDDASEQAWMWVRVPSVGNTTDTELYLYYDMDHADNTVYVGDTGSTAAQNVWDSGFKGVWHLSDPSGGVGAIKDSTSNNNAGTDNGSPTFNATGLIDSAISFDGFDDYINMSNSASLQFTSSLTIEGWINLQSFGSGSDVDIVLRKGEGTPNDYQLAIHDQKLALMIEEGDASGLESTANLTSTTWYYLAGTWNNSTRRVYLNGSENGSGSKTGNMTPDTRDIYIGGRSGTDLSTGIIDEVRASNTTRSAAWIKASYESGRDDLLDFGAGESEGTSEGTYDYVLRVNNTVTDSWQIRLKKYSDSNINRLQNCTIYFHNSTDGTSSQIDIQDGSYTNQTGPWYDLGDSETIYIALTVQANSTATSYICTYLEIRTPNTTTYAQYVITFEIT
ncbi:MAG: hypothetical protein NWE97_00410 [Candidatus Bathyarchaeota archaeon]|nr:hypothetical protein [Candidatus Bathyarchaeota archaeon]